jgi:hypothetical protein
MRAALTGLWATEVDEPFYHTVYFAHKTQQTGTQLGRPWGRYGGTNGLGPAMGPVILGELAKVGRKATPIVAEGHRLATKDFFSGVKAAGWTLDVVYLDVPDDVAADRRRSVNIENQYPLSNATVVRRASDIRALWEQYRNPWHLDGTARLRDLTDQLRTHPVIRSLWGLDPNAQPTAADLRLMARGIPRPVNYAE